ncbi:phosphotransferase [Nocardioides daeguensis]|uniref:Aminoglycoside phosphotransferase domain-containing protein n=1 Tax=Nocardioides daeguensis TaxID=908359 RepID=A0ABP6VX91_9ACTN|nr:phosphotransferase [Nocardioides daeguensis]MBV6726889.1 aminoglycoside phosphotransferase family protein [Nocardioides daeguensis]MCR1774359.1 aminoglycoside phosphotransferase family protein [Nocardioides daeguensis]
MHDRSALGPADVDDDVLAAMVAELLGVDDVELLSSRAHVVDYNLPAITTGGRWWVSGTAAVDGHAHDFRLFVKHVHEWSRSPLFLDVPEESRSWAAAMVPWRTEGAVYRSDLADRLPPGLAMPRALGVHDLDTGSYTVWLEVVPTVDVAWDLERHRQAAHLLGRLAGSPAVRELAGVGGHDWNVGRYVEGRLGHQVVPVLGSEDVWRHPLVAAAFGELRPRLLAVLERLPQLVAELLAVPLLVGHGDACPNNLLVRPDRDGFTLIDFGFFMALPVGFDLGQLLVGELQLGRGTADGLAERDEACLAAYVDGLAAEGVDLEIATVRRAHALHLLIFSGLSAIPFEVLEAEPTDALRAMAATRAAIARYSLDLLDQTG